VFKFRSVWTVALFSICLNQVALPISAQTIPFPQLPLPPTAPNLQIPPVQTVPSSPLLNPSIPPQQFPQLPKNQRTFKVKLFIFAGTPVLKLQQIEKEVAPYLGRNTNFIELQELADRLTYLSRQKGYIYSGAYIPRLLNRQWQTTDGNTVTIRFIAGRVKKINVIGDQRLRRYVRSHLRVASSPVLNKKRLEEGLRLLQVDPLIKTISAELTPNPRLGLATLDVRVTANQSISVQPTFNNERSPLVGTFERRVQFYNSNLLGLGDGLSLTYRNTEGSNAGQASYRIPINPRNGTVEFDYTIVHANIVERPFNQLNISEIDRSYQVTLRQPLLRQASATATKEFAVGLTASRQEGDERLLGMPFPISPGADDRGRTRISALRFFQDWNQRSNQEVLSVRSQFSLGVGALNATIHNSAAPDSRFFSWQGQATWLRRLNKHNLALLTRANLQLASRPLVPFEQFSLGGITTVRGYRQDALLTDNGILGSVELRVPIVQRGVNQLLLGPFVDVGYGFNVRGANPNTNTLVGAGLGIEYEFAQRLRLRLDYGIPLIAFPNNQKRTLQENGLYLNFSYLF